MAPLSSFTLILRAEDKRLNMEEKKTYEKPQLTVVSFKVEYGYAASGTLTGVFRLGNSWSNDGIDAWDDEAISGGNRFGGGWVDNGNSAWD